MNCRQTSMTLTIKEEPTDDEYVDLNSSSQTEPADDDVNEDINSGSQTEQGSNLLVTGRIMQVINY